MELAPGRCDGITLYETDGKPNFVPFKTVLRLPMSAFRPTRVFVERLITEMLEAANAKRGPGYYLDLLLRSWKDAGCNLEKWALANPANFTKLRETCGEWRIRPFDGLVPERGRYRPILQGPLGLDASAETRDQAEERVAYDTFTAFVLTCAMLPRSRIGVCDRCGNLYWALPRRKLNKRFCRRKCAQLQTASEAQAKRLAEERRQKNERIQQAIEEFRKKKRFKADWKAFVAGRARVTRSYLTRSLNRGLRGEADGLKLTNAQVQYLESKGRSPHANL